MLLACVNNREEGFLGLWKGVTPNVGRNAIINAAELASYDTVNIPTKRSALRSLASGMLSGHEEEVSKNRACSDVADKVSVNIHWVL